MDNEQLKNDQISIIALDDSKLEGIAGGGSVSSVTRRHDERKRERQAAAEASVVLSDEELEDIAGGVLDKDIANRAKHEFGELADEQLAQVAGGEGILDDLDPVLLELLRQRPQF